MFAFPLRLRLRRICCQGLGRPLFWLGISIFLTPLTALGQWRGADRDGSYPDKDLLTSWPEGGPPLIWSMQNIGNGYGSISVQGRLCYTTGQEESQDVLYCIKDGSQKWKVSYGPSWDGSYPETRCTPTIVDGRVYVTSGNGVVACIDADAPKILWKKDAFNDHGGECGRWGIAENLLVSGEHVFFTTGGKHTTMIALNRNTGQTVWKSKSLDDQIAYTSPILIETDHGKTVVNMTGKYLFGVDAQTGTILWTYRYYDLDRPGAHPTAPVINAVTPLYHDGRIFITSGYDHVGAQFQLTADSVTLLWKSPTLDCHMGGVVLLDGHIYGANWESNAKGAWCCLDWDSGETRWEHTWHNKGSIIAADGHLYCYEEKRGHLGLVRASPHGFELVSSFQIQQGEGPHWSHPSIHRGVLYVRHGTAVMAYNIRANTKR